MAVTRGCFGKVYAKDLAATGAATQVYEVRSWSYEETAERLDASEMGTCTKKFEAGAQETTGQIQCWWDPSATGNQGQLTVGNIVELELYPEGAGSGSVYYTTPAAGATVLSVAREGSVDGLVGSTFGWAVNGALTATTVP
ncbi:MAG: hypothetical protein KDI07_05270 [Anaerolineae bacterium]|nr:hypothetical protein [Anaerolineae bacterium]